MFFSVIIPTYNPRRYLPVLLSSIARNECVDDIEVIISDDCSNESFDEILESFSMLHIVMLRNEKHYGFPKNGRQHGADTATGKWICFADQDDCYVDNAFDKIQKFILENDVKNYLVGNFIMHPEGTDRYVLYDGTKGWTHGKFYEKIFWDDNELGYDDVKYCEDINLSAKTGCVLTIKGIPMVSYPEPIYIWNRHEDSLCNDDYFLKSMPDYVRGTLGVIVDYIRRYRFNTEAVKVLSIKFIQTMYHVYFYFQCDKLNRDRKNLMETMLILYPIFEDYKDITATTTEDLLSRTSGDLRSLYAETRNDDCTQIPFTEQMTFQDFIHYYLG